MLNAIEALIATTLVNSNNSPAEFVLTNNVLKEICDMKKKKKLQMNKYVWCNKININIRKRVYWN